MSQKLKYFQDIIFPEEEYRMRLKKTRELMNKKNIDCLIISDDRMTWYFTGFGTITPIGSRARPRILIIPFMEEPIFYVHQSTVNCVKEMVWFDRVVGYSDITQAPIEMIASTIKEICGSEKRVGFELGQDQRLGFSVRDFLHLRDSLKDFEFIDSADLLLRLRMVKSEQEVKRIRRACEITSLTYDYAFPKIQAGMTEREIGTLMERTMNSYGAMGTWVYVLTSDYQRIDGVLRNKKSKKGDLVYIDMGANFGGYWADFSRAGVLGSPSAEQERMQNLTNEVCIIGVEACRIGRTMSQVANIVEKALVNRGLIDNKRNIFSSHASRYGHGIGIFTTEPPNFSLYDHTVIEKNMVLTMEPGIIKKDGYFHIEEDFLITETGTEVLSTSKQELIHIYV